MSKKIEIVEHKLFKIIGKCADKLNMKAFVVGGWVRDFLLNRHLDKVEFDIVCNEDGILLASTVAKELNIKKVNIYKNFGTAALNYNNINLEFNGARKESYKKESRNPKIEKGTIKDDQNRRDFTINAMSVGLNADNFGEFIDPFGGINDLKNKVIKTPLNPIKTYDDDPLRMMRAIRFASVLNFKIEKTSLEAIKNQSERLEIIKQERITEEFNKIMLSEKPSIGLNLLSESGLLKIFLPEFELLRGIESINGVKHKDNFYHTLQVLDNVSKISKSLWLRWAALLHDIAKPKTKRFDHKNGWTFHGHEYIGSKMVFSIFKKMKLPTNEHMQYVQKLVLLHLRPIALVKHEVTDSAIRRLLFDAQNDIDDLMILCNADITSKNEHKVAKYKNNLKQVAQKITNVEKRDKIRNWKSPINGNDIMQKLDLKGGKTHPVEGRKIALIKNKIKDAILDGKIKNNYTDAEKLMYKIAQEITEKK